MVDLNMSHWSSNEFGSKIAWIALLEYLSFTLVELVCLDLSDMSSNILTDTLVCTYPMNVWSGKLDKSLEILGLFGGVILDV